jgi:hypothetical protein
MNPLPVWTKLNYIASSKNPLDTAKKMLATAELTEDEAAWAVATLAMLPVALINSLQEG